MTTRDTDGTVKRLHLDQADVSIRILADIAETTFDLRFRNDGERPVEGEFVMPLPEGATVSGYALEVNGKLRDSVAVEKERARNAYESIKRRMVDPGLVEREAGNIYRTRVFPVPAKGTKRLRISYTETLRPAPDGFAYSLPLDFPEALDVFSCKVRGTGTGSFRVTDVAGLEFTASAVGDQSVERKDFKPAGTLQLIAAKLDEPVLIVEDEGAHPAFYLTMVMPEIPARPRTSPESILLVWDASQSGLTRDHAKEFEVLDRWFAKLRKSRVSLQLLRDRVEDVGEFEVRDGRWDKLKQTLEHVDYDGATCLSAMKAPAKPVDLVVYLGDGVATLGSASWWDACKFMFIHSGPPATANFPGRHACLSGGEVIDLATDTPQAALTKLTQQRLKFFLVGTGTDADMFDIDRQPGQRLRIFDTLADPQAATLELRYGFDNDHLTPIKIACQRGTHPGGIIRRLHAQRVLTDIEHLEHPDRRNIIKHCKTYGLVSDYTSLIVLDRIEDYVQYHIQPPEPELQADYQNRLADYDRQHAAGPAGAWAAKLRWYGTLFPDYDALIQPRLKQVGIWIKAIESQFTPAQRDPEAFATIAGWFNKAAALIAERPKLRTNDDYRKWKKSIDELDALGPKLSQTPLHPPPAGQPLTVSVRGLVANPGLVTGDPGMTLRQALTQAAGPQPLANLDCVALYRNAGKTVFNTTSHNYQDAPLFPGDMVVVDQPPDRNDGCFADPFAAPQAPADPGNQDPIREQKDVWITGQPTPPDDFESTSADDGFRARPAIPARINDAGNGTDNKPISNITPAAPSAEPVAATPAAMEDFAKAIAAGADPQAAYRAFKGQNVYQPRGYVDAARILFAHHHDALATRALSNLVEARPGDESALRGYAFWLAEFGQSPQAELALDPLAGDNLLACLDLSSMRAAGMDLPNAAQVLLQSLPEALSNDSGTLTAIALTEFNGLYHRLGDPQLHHPVIRNMQSLAADIRIVLTSSGDGGSLDFSVVEPGDQPCSVGNSPSQFGGRITGANGVGEYMIRHAVPGIYQIHCTATHATTVRAVIHTHWGRKDQQTKVVTQWLEPGKIQQIGEIQYEFEPIDNR